MRRFARAVVVLVALPSLFARTQEKPHADPVVAPKYASRFGGRAALADPKLAESIRLALVWLRDHQAKDGRWDSDAFMTLEESGTKSDDPGSPVHDVGITGLALLALLADGSTTTRGEFQESVRRGISWLRTQQNSRGMFGSFNSNEYFYSHLIASIAMTEAFGLSGDPELRGAAQAGVRFVESFRNPDRVWRYQPRAGENDTSVTTWAMSGLLAARDFGLEVDPNALAAGDQYLADMTDEISGRTGYTEKGGYSSRRRGEHGERFPREANETMTGAALFVEFELECDPQQRPEMSKQIQRVLTRLPDWEPAIGSVDFYAWYHGSMAMRQAGDASWKIWSKALQDALVPHQRRDGHFAGSWDPVGPWGHDGGRIYATAMGALALSAWYRFAEIAKLTLLPDTAAFRSANSAWSEGHFDDVATALSRLVEKKESNPLVPAPILQAWTSMECKRSSRNLMALAPAPRAKADSHVAAPGEPGGRNPPPSGAEEGKEGGGKGRFAGMRDRHLYATILGLREPWSVIDVELDAKLKTVRVMVVIRDGTVVACPMRHPHKSLKCRMRSPESRGSLWCTLFEATLGLHALETRSTRTLYGASKRWTFT